MLSRLPFLYSASSQLQRTNIASSTAPSLLIHTQSRKCHRWSANVRKSSLINSLKRSTVCLCLLNGNNFSFLTIWMSGMCRCIQDLLNQSSYGNLNDNPNLKTSVYDADPDQHVLKRMDRSCDGAIHLVGRSSR